MKRSDFLGAVLWGSLSLLMLLFIYGQSMLPPDESGEMSGLVLMFLRPIMNLFPTLDLDTFHILIRKAAHFTEYALFSLFFTMFVRKIKWKSLLFSLPVSLIVAASDEFLQKFTGRGSSVWDVLLDFSGALFAFLIVWLLSRKFLIKENENEA